MFLRKGRHEMQDDIIIWNNNDPLRKPHHSVWNFSVARGSGATSGRTPENAIKSLIKAPHKSPLTYQLFLLSSSTASWTPSLGVKAGLQSSYLANSKLGHSNSSPVRNSSRLGVSLRTSMADANLTGPCIIQVLYAG